MIKAIECSELERACALLFGSEFQCNKQTLQYLQPSGIKTAFRKMAKKYHPDCIQSSNISKTEQTDRFKEIHNAYTLLIQTLSGKQRQSINADSQPVKKKNSPTPRRNSSKNRDFFYTGSIPKQKMRLGEFIYYSKKISWGTLVNALIHQKKIRPRLGKLLTNLGYINTKDIMLILSRSEVCERFGDTALRLQKITTYQLYVALGKQKGFNQPIGLYFTENDFLTKAELNYYLGNLQKHNNVCSWSRRAGK